MTKTKLYAPAAVPFSRSWWSDGMRNMFFVVIITLLIWVYADMDVADDVDYRATIVLTTGNSQEVALVPAEEVPLKFTLRGTRRSLREFQDYLDQKGSMIEYDVSRFEPGTREALTEDVLNQSDTLDRLGLLMVSAAPSKITFSLEKRVRVLAKVELDYTGAMLVEPPRITPAEVSVLLARTDRDRLRQGLPAGEPIRLKTKQLDLSNAPTGQLFTRQVGLRKPTARFEVILATKSVSVDLKIDQRTDRKVITIMVQTISPSSWSEKGGTWQEYNFVKKSPLEWRRQITVSGAKKDIERLRSEDVEAYVTLTDQDKAPVESWLTRPVKVQFAIGMDLKILGEQPVVNFKLQKRAAAPAPVP